MQHFPKLLSSQIAFDIARVILDGFDKHYSLFRQASQAARDHFERMTWKEAQAQARERIAFYVVVSMNVCSYSKMNTKKQS